MNVEIWLSIVFNNKRKLRGWQVRSILIFCDISRNFIVKQLQIFDVPSYFQESLVWNYFDFLFEDMGYSSIIYVLYFVCFDINVIVLLFRFPTLIVPVPIIAWIKFTSSVWLIGNSGTVVRGTARPGTRETPASLKAWKKRNWNRTFIIQIKFKYNTKTYYKIHNFNSSVFKINQSNISNRRLLF